MNARRNMWICLSLLAPLVATGCRTGMSGNLAAKPDSIAPRPSLNAQAAIDRHNRNAEQISSLEAKPAVSVSANGGGAGLRGRMALELPRNFDLEMSGGGRDQAKIGSNDQGFWFWVNEKKDPAIYVCAYDDLGRANLTSTMQPDWIIEALGLRPISPEEAATVAAKPGDRYGTLWLTQRRKAANGETLTKRMLIDERGLIHEHQILAGTSTNLLAKATVQEFKTVAVDAEDGSSDGKAITIPYRFKLEWVKEKLALEMTMNNVKLNPVFDAPRREAIFTEPSIPGAPRVDLAKTTARQPSQTQVGSRIAESVPPSYQRRTTRPAPPAGGIELSDPEPLSAEGASRGRRDPVALSADLGEVPPARDRVVRPEIPRPLDP